MVRQIPGGYELVIRGEWSPVIARTPVAWRNWRYRLARLRGRHIAAVHAAPLRAATGAQDAPAADPVDAPTISAGKHAGRPALPDEAVTSKPWHNYLNEL